MSKQLKPCPFCEHINDKDKFQVCSSGGIRSRKYQLICEKCGAYGPAVEPMEESKAMEEVAKIWNIRAIDDKGLMVISPQGHENTYFKTLRDEFAMQFEPLTNEEIGDYIEGGETPEECQARLAYGYADAMMKEREK